MRQISISSGKVSGTNSLTPIPDTDQGVVFGGALITTDGTNQATVTVRKNNGSGAIVFQVATVSAGMFACAVDMGKVSAVHTVVSGTGAEAQFYQAKDV